MSNQSDDASGIKKQIDELRGKWDRLDAHGSQSARQTQITREIEQLKEKLQKLTGENY